MLPSVKAQCAQHPTRITYLLATLYAAYSIDRKKVRYLSIYKGKLQFEINRVVRANRRGCVVTSVQKTRVFYYLKVCCM